jgi:hypothetical protein
MLRPLIEQIVSPLILNWLSSELGDEEIDSEMRVALTEETVDADETLDRFGIDSVVRPGPTAHLSRQLCEPMFIVNRLPRDWHPG